MELPSKWLSFALIVHGLLGAFGEVLDSILNKMATPLGNFYNESLILHYDYSLDEASLQTTLSIMGNLKLVGSICAVIWCLPKMDSWGRKPLAVYLRTALSGGAATLMIIAKFANSIELFALGILLMGAGLPLRTGINKLYLSECAPDAIRGFTTQAIATCSQAVLLIGGVFMMPATFGNDELWYLVPALALFMAVIYVSLSAPLPESPKFLSISGEKVAACDAVRKYHGEKVNLEEVFREFELEFKTTASSHTSVRELWSDTGLRGSLYLVFVTALVPYFGIPQIFYLNGISMKIQLGFSNEQALLIDLIFSFLFIPISIVLPYLYERVGRRPVFLVTNILSMIGSVAVFLAQLIFRLMGPSVITIALGGMFSFIFMLVTSMGASIFYVILIADLLPASAKSATTQAAILTSSISAIIANFGYAILEPWLGAGVFAPFVLAQLFFVIYCWRNLPETRQLSVYQNFEEMRSRANSFIPMFSPSRRTTLNYGTQRIHK